MVLARQPENLLHRRAKQISILLVVFTLVTMLATPVRVRAWNPTAHQIVAYIAYKNLTPTVRHKVDDLLRHHMDFKLWQARVKKGDPYVRSRPTSMSPGNDEFDLNIFLLAAIWADEIKTDKRFQNTKSSSLGSPILADFATHREWHFIDLPFSADGTPTSPPTSPNMLEVLPLLRADIGLIGLDANAQAYDLAWLIHLVGDAHQPLHCSTRFSASYPARFGDSGGNAFKIMKEGQPTTLHIYWDGLLGTYSVSTFKKAADSIMRVSKPKMPVDLSEQAWVEESFEMAKTFVYTVDGGQPGPYPAVSKSYDLLAKKKARERVTLAGYRLAAILNEKLQ